MQQLREANRLDIVLGIRQQGGRHRVAASMQLQCYHPKLKFPTVAVAGKALQAFAKQHQLDPHRAPSFTELRLAGRHDLIVSYRKVGQARLLEAACLKPNVGGRPSKHLLVDDLSSPPPHPLPPRCVALHASSPAPTPRCLPLDAPLLLTLVPPLLRLEHWNLYTETVMCMYLHISNLPAM